MIPFTVKFGGKSYEIYLEPDGELGSKLWEPDASLNHIKYPSNVIWCSLR